MAEEIKLKPCPFCGEKAFWDYDFSSVYCRCGAEFNFFKSDKEVAEKWNSRPIEDDLNKHIGRFKKYTEALENEIKELREAIKSGKKDAE